MRAEIRRLLEQIDELGRVERERLAKAYRLPYDQHGVTIRSAKLEAYAEVKEAALKVASPVEQERQEYLPVNCEACGLIVYQPRNKNL